MKNILIFFLVFIPAIVYTSPESRIKKRLTQVYYNNLAKAATSDTAKIEEFIDVLRNYYTKKKGILDERDILIEKLKESKSKYAKNKAIDRYGETINEYNENVLYKFFGIKKILTEDEFSSYITTHLKYKKKFQKALRSTLGKVNSKSL